ncbi:MAG: NADH-quinone oxidoreductase subunit N [Gammaproteobacteria bacterium]|nr:NADH-quinone oxidoreductase subunit N [Pseudomonadales bacterium]
METAITIQDLVPLLPVLVVTGVAVLAMLLIALKRNHTLIGATTIIGLGLALITAFLVLPFAGQQVTPLLMIDNFSLFFTIVILLAAGFIAVFSFPYLYHLKDEVEEYYLLLLIATIGALIMVSSNHFLSAFLGLETLSISLYAMIAYPLHSKEAVKFPVEASLKYLVLSAVSSALILFGIALLYAQTGSLQFTELAMTGGSVADGYFITALVLLFAGVGFKLSLAPFHMWTPDVYEGAPLPATMYLATVGKAAMMVLLLRFVVASQALSFHSVVVVIGCMAVLSILAGNLLALVQENLKRILAYSSIAHMGYLLIALIALDDASTRLGVEAISFYLIAYIVMSLGAFGVATVISSSEKEFDFVADYQGLFWREPWLALLLTAMLLSLAGIPLTVGFIGKFYVVLAGVEGSLWGLLLVLVVGSGISIYYYLRIVYRMLLQPQLDQAYREAGWDSIGSYAVLALLLALLLLLGVYPGFLMSIIEVVSVSI